MSIRSMVLAMAMAMALAVGAEGTRAAAGGVMPQEPKASLAMTTVNLNTATQAELEKLPGVGPAMATRILEYRQKSGGFKKIEELMNVKGLGEKSFLKLRPQITIAPSKAAER